MTTMTMTTGTPREDDRYLSIGQAKARLTVCRNTLAAGGWLADAAETLDMDTSALWHFLKRRKHFDVMEGLSQPPDQRARLPLQQRISRLKRAHALGTSLAARALGLEYMALYMWLRNNAPDGPRAALEKLGVSV